MSKINVGNPTIECPECGAIWIVITTQKGHPTCPNCRTEISDIIVDKKKWETRGNLELVKDS